MLTLFKNISIYSLGNILNKGVMFLLLPLYTRVLSPADYGKLELVYLVGTILAMIYGLKVEMGYNRIYFQNTEIRFRKTLFSTGQLFNLVCGLAFSGFILVKGDSIASYIFDYSEGAYFLKLIAIITVLEVLTHIPFNNLRVRQEAKRFVIFNFVKLISVTSLTVYFVAFAKLGVVGVLYAKIIGDIITLIALYIETRAEYHLKFSFTQLKLMLSFSVFLIPGALSALILNMSNRYFLQEYQTLDDVGLYSLGAKLAGIIPFLFTEPVKKAFSPHLYELIDNPTQCKKTLADFSHIFLTGLSIVALAVSLFSRELIMIMSDESYSGSHNIVFVLSISYLFLGLAGIVVTGIHITKKTWIISVIWPVSAVLNIALNIWLIPGYGRVGAAYATMVSVIIICILYFTALYKVYPVKFKYINFFKILILMVFFNYLGSLVIMAFIPSVLLKLVLFSGYIVAIYFSGVLGQNEMQKIRLLLNRKTDI